MKTWQVRAGEGGEVEVVVGEIEGVAVAADGWFPSKDEGEGVG